MSGAAPGDSSAAPPARAVREQPAGTRVPLWVHPGWSERFPWLLQGTTGRADADGEAWDLGLGGDQPVGPALGRWHELMQALDVSGAVHALQVHGAELRHHPLGVPGLRVLHGADAHLTAEPGLLLSVSVADCVPVFLVSERPRALALLHAGWRGVAAGIVERGVAALAERFGAAPGSLWLHCGPAICGRCYEVGPEVHAAVDPGRGRPSAPAPVDLRAAIARRAAALGVAPEHQSVSAHCTRCGPPDFFSHRGGDAGRQMALLALRG